MPKRRDSGLQFLGFAWPALAAASVAEVSSAWARAFIDAAAPDEKPEATEPGWTTTNQPVLDLQGVRLREFASGAGTPTLICAPYTLHDAMMVDFAPGHSVVAALLGAGLRNVFVTQWRSATPEMCHWTIDEYLSELNVLIDHLGGSVNLIGVCQGGWLGLIYAARFPAKVKYTDARRRAGRSRRGRVSDLAHCAQHTARAVSRTHRAGRRPDDGSSRHAILDVPA